MKLNSALIKFRDKVHILDDTAYEFTSSTSLAYTGKSVTIPANCIFSITAAALYSSSKPMAITINSLNNNAYQMTSAGRSDDYQYSLSTTFTNATGNSSQTFYIFAKYPNSSTNAIRVSGWYIELD